jgi:predicted dehydrogenase
MHKPMRFVLAGLGFWGRSWAKLLKTHPWVDFVATIDPSESARDWCREHLELAHFPDLTTALGAVSADAVLVATPPNLHRPVVLEALQHGKHVLVEKPLSASRDDAVQILRAAESFPAKVMVAQGYRFLDSATALRQSLQNGTIGQLRAIRILFRQYVPDLLQGNHPLYRLEHSILVDMANHHFDLIRFITGQEFSKVSAIEHQTPDNAFHHPSNAICLLTLADGIPVFWDGDWCHRGRRTSWEGDWEFIGSNARIFWRGEPDPGCEDRFLPFISLQCAGTPTERLPFRESVVDRRVPVLEHFIHSITHGKQPEPSVSDNLKMLQAIFGCIESARSGRELVLT